MDVMTRKKNVQPTDINNRETPNGEPAENSRQRILLAAGKVFAEQPYHMATVRMVGKAGGFDHQLISYYFPTKADLFEAVVAKACNEYYEGNKRWLEALDRSPTSDDFALYLDLLLDFHFANPEPLRIMALNGPLIERLEEIPGYQHILEALEKTRATFESVIPLKEDSKKIGRFINTFNTLVINYLGAAPSQAEILGMDPNGGEYRTWVKETLLYVFTPLLKELVLTSRTDA